MDKPFFSYPKLQSYICKLCPAPQNVAAVNNPLCNAALRRRKS